MKCRLFNKTKKKHEFEIQAIKNNKKVNPKGSAQETPQVVIPVNPSNTPKRKKVSDLSPLEKHYYEQIKGLLKKTNKESIKKSIIISEDRDEITKTQLLAILDMF